MPDLFERESVDVLLFLLSYFVLIVFWYLRSDILPYHWKPISISQWRFWQINLFNITIFLEKTAFLKLNMRITEQLRQDSHRSSSSIFGKYSLPCRVSICSLDIIYTCVIRLDAMLKMAAAWRNEAERLLVVIEGKMPAIGVIYPPPEVRSIFSNSWYDYIVSQCRVCSEIVEFLG